MIFFGELCIAVGTPTSSVQVEPSETTNMVTQTAGKYVLSISSTPDPLPTTSAFYLQSSNPQSSQPKLPAAAAPAGVNGAVVGVAIAALSILVVFAAAVKSHSHCGACQKTICMKSQLM